LAGWTATLSKKQAKAERIDENVALATFDLLARIEALRVEPSPPFCAPFALWLSA